MFNFYFNLLTLQNKKRSKKVWGDADVFRPDRFVDKTPFASGYHINNNNNNNNNNINDNINNNINDCDENNEENEDQRENREIMTSLYSFGVGPRQCPALNFSKQVLFNI